MREKVEASNDRTKSTIKYLGCVFLASLLLGFIFGPKYLDLTPVWIIGLSAFVAVITGLKEYLSDVIDKKIFGIVVQKEVKALENLSSKQIKVTNNLKIIEPLVDQVLKENSDIRAMDMAKIGAQNTIYAKLVKDHGILVGKPKLIGKILRNRSEI